MIRLFQFIFIGIISIIVLGMNRACGILPGASAELTSVPPTSVAAAIPSETATTTVLALPSATREHSPTPTELGTLTAVRTDTVTPTNTPTPTNRPTRRAIKLPTIAPTPSAAPAPLPAFNPLFPDAWPRTIRFTPAEVAAGQAYWRLASAVFCDVPQKGHEHQETCPDYPGGMLDHTVYIAVLDENGHCVAPVKVMHEINTGDRPPVGKNHEAYPWTSCATDYQWPMYGEASDFWIDGLPSDRIGGLVLNSPQLNWAENRAHVRYFLIFQRTAR